MSSQHDDDLCIFEESEPKEKEQSTEVQENFDVEFEVEGKLLKANRNCLSMISPVFKVMLKGEFKEKEETIIPLPGKVYDDMLEFIEVTHTGKALDMERTKQLLPLAHEYDCKSVLQRCEEFLLKTPVSFDLFLLASMYNLEQLEEECMNGLLSCNFNDRTSVSYDQLDSHAKVKYLERKLENCEGELQSLKLVEKKMEKVEKCLSESLTNVICCDAELDKIRLKENQFRVRKSGSYNDGNHIAGSMGNSCERCILFKYWTLKNLLSESSAFGVLLPPCASRRPYPSFPVPLS